MPNEKNPAHPAQPLPSPMPAIGPAPMREPQIHRTWPDYPREGGMPAPTPPQWAPNPTPAEDPFPTPSVRAFTTNFTARRDRAMPVYSIPPRSRS